MTLNLYLKYLLCCELIIMVFIFRKFLPYDVNSPKIAHGTNFKSTVASHRTNPMRIAIPWTSLGKVLS